jgi:DHA2 family methylenomycin A resistance protein-like MFS transporter
MSTDASVVESGDAPGSQPTDRTPRQLWFGLAAIGTGFFLVILDATIVSLALPAIGSDLHAGLFSLQWVISSYTVVLAALLLTAGAATDRFGARRLFLIGLAVFTVASVACALAQSAPVLIGARIGQAVGVAGMLPASLALVGVLFPEGKQRARAVAVWASVAGAGLAIGPVAGGVFVATVGWRYIFAINVPICLVAAAIIWRCVPAQAPGHSRLDLPGVVAAALFCGGLTYAVIGSDGSARTSVIFLAAVAAIIGLLALVLIERRSKAPMLTGELLRHRTVTFGSLAGLLYNFGLYGLIFLISLYLQGSRHVGSIAVGVSLLPLAGAALAVALGASALMHRLGPRICTSVGMGCACLGTLAILSYTDHPSLAWVVFPGAIVGFGGGLFTPSISNAVLSGAPDGQQGRASALLNASRQFGSALGAAVVGSVLSMHPSSVEFQHALFTVAGAYLAGSLLCAVMLPRRTTAS